LAHFGKNTRGKIHSSLLHLTEGAHWDDGGRLAEMENVNGLLHVVVREFVNVADMLVDARESVTAEEGW
jgi:hypothetical protein